MTNATHSNPTSTKEVTRFAPSPSGYLHLGHAFAALTAYHARGAGGSFLLRIEDIDASRSREQFVDAIYEDLRWLGIDWEKPVRRQSQHMDDYRAALRRLKGLTYPCFCTRAQIKEEIARAGHAPQGPDGAIYPGICKNLSDQQRAHRIASDNPNAERLNMTAAIAHANRDANRHANAIASRLTWEEVGQGIVHAQPLRFGDAVLARKDMPTSYHLAVTVDDHLQGVTLVTRGIDLAPSTDLHRLLQALLGYPPPTYHHHPLLTDTNGKRLAKRDHAMSVRALRESGHDARAVVEMAMAGGRG